MNLNKVVSIDHDHIVAEVNDDGAITIVDMRTSTGVVITSPQRDDAAAIYIAAIRSLRAGWIRSENWAELLLEARRAGANSKMAIDRLQHIFASRQTHTRRMRVLSAALDACPLAGGYGGLAVGARLLGCSTDPAWDSAEYDMATSVLALVSMDYEGPGGGDHIRRMPWAQTLTPNWTCGDAEGDVADWRFASHCVCDDIRSTYDIVVRPAHVGRFAISDSEWVYAWSIREIDRIFEAWISDRGADMSSIDVWAGTAHCACRRVREDARIELAVLARASVPDVDAAERVMSRISWALPPRWLTDVPDDAVAAINHFIKILL